LLVLTARRVVLVSFLCLPALMGHAAPAADFHVSTAGKDAQDGASPDRAWRTIARANRQTLRPGDRLLFRGGDAFAGNLVVKVAGAPSAAAPVVIGSYAGGKAIVRAGDGTGILCTGTGGLVVRDLIVEGKDRHTNTGNGVSILNTLPGGKRLEFIRILNVEARRFGKYGIAVGGWPADGSQSGFRDVRISGCRASANVYGGIHVYGFHDYYAKTYAHTDVTVVDCLASDNTGDPNYLEQHSGNGILLHDVDGGLIDRCTASGNGGLCRAKSGGPVGIWAWSSRKLVIQNCVSVRNHTGGKYDGGGFDVDGGVSDSVVQYNYSAENDGAGFLVFDFGAAPFRLTDNVVRFNISENDGRKNGYAGIDINSFGAPIERVQVYHNTVFAGRSASADQPEALFIRQSKNCRIHNNLLIASGGCALADVAGGQSGLAIQGNHYWAADGAFLIRYAGKPLNSLAEWQRQSGLERLDGRDVGSTGDPQVKRVQGAVIMDAGKRGTLERYRLRPQSPLLRSGLDLRALFRIDPGAYDFGGDRLRQDAPPAVGAWDDRLP
jgi:hypothetical protein